MGKPTGFLEYDRVNGKAAAPLERIKNFNEFHTPLTEAQQRKQGARCMECGVPFCQSGMMMNGMVSGCPLHNLVPEWNDLVYTGTWGQAYNRLKKTNSFPEFTSRVCPAPCEAACTCGLNGDPVSIKEMSMPSLKRRMRLARQDRDRRSCALIKKSQSSAPARPAWLRQTS